MKKGEAIELTPSAKRLTQSFRDVGYDFHTAIADLVDNSIEAGASRVDILVMFDGEGPYVCIADNGRGMDKDTLKEAMRYGSEREYELEELGKFGLGLNTASTSQCTHYSVGTRNDKKKKKIISFCWDLDHIKKTNRWEILPARSRRADTIINDQLAEHTGTVVLWENLDRVLDYNHPYGERARTKLNSLCRELEEHLAMVFHKFLSKETPRKGLKIFLNDNEIEPWDPFARSEPKTKKITPIKIDLDHDGIKDELILQPYILPRKDDFTSSDEFKRLSGPKNWNQQQGFYIYRAHRMIQSGGWNRLRTRDEHTKLCRIEINFSPKFDGAFGINIAKMSVKLPGQIRDQIEQAIGPALKIARDYYSEKRTTTTTTVREPVETTQTEHDEDISDTEDHETEKEMKEEANTFTLLEIEKMIMRLAEGKIEKTLITEIFKRLREELGYNET